MSSRPSAGLSVCSAIQTRGHHDDATQFTPSGCRGWTSVLRGPGIRTTALGDRSADDQWSVRTAGDLLADDQTVVTYDPHGLGASTTTNPTHEVSPEIEAEDLARIVDAVGADKADV